VGVAGLPKIRWRGLRYFGTLHGLVELHQDLAQGYSQRPYYFSEVHDYEGDKTIMMKTSP